MIKRRFLPALLCPMMVLAGLPMFAGTSVVPETLTAFADSSDGAALEWNLHDQRIEANDLSFSTAALGYAIGDGGTVFTIDEGTDTVAGTVIGAPTRAAGYSIADKAVATIGNQAIAFGENGSIGWIRANAGSYGSVDQPALSGDFRAADSYGDEYAIAVGTKGLAVKVTTSGSVPVATRLTGVHGNLNGVCVADAGTIWIVGDEGAVFRSTDGGAGWSVVDINTTDDLTEIDFDSAGNGIITTENALFLTRDRGATWQKIETEHAFTNVLALGENRFLVCDGGEIYLSTGGESWSLSYTMTSPVVALQRSDYSGRIYVVAADGSVAESDSLLTKDYINGHIRVQVDGRRIRSDVEPFILNGRTLVPVRFVAEALGCDVQWDGGARTVTITDATRQIELKIGEISVSVVNRETGEMGVVEIDTPASIKDGRTFVPIRFVSETLGARMDWDNSQRMVSITRG